MTRLAIFVAADGNCCSCAAGPLVLHTELGPLHLPPVDRRFVTESPGIRSIPWTCPAGPSRGYCWRELTVRFTLHLPSAADRRQRAGSERDSCPPGRLRGRGGPVEVCQEVSRNLCRRVTAIRRWTSWPARQLRASQYDTANFMVLARQLRAPGPVDLHRAHPFTSVSSNHQPGKRGLVIFPPRWLVGEGPFSRLVPPPQRDVGVMGLSRWATTPRPRVPARGPASQHFTSHRPGCRRLRPGRHVELAPQKFTGTLCVYMFESPADDHPDPRHEGSAPPSPTMTRSWAWPYPVLRRPAAHRFDRGTTVREAGPAVPRPQRCWGCRRRGSTGMLAY